ncbi:MAG: glutathione S-transferase family protein [Gammaproteobacteria bacterium]|nr:glutathione S-transferase family protein [Gammaproteobacteria bacterium]
MKRFKLIAHTLCPYVQRSVITLLEKSVRYERVDIDLANKPEWFKKLSPMGKVPLLVLNEQDVLFESAVICEYIDNVTDGALLATEPLLRAKQQAWIEFGSNILQMIAKWYHAQSHAEFLDVSSNLHKAMEHLEAHIKLPYFYGDNFTLVDAVYGPIFRYFVVLESQGVITPLENHMRVRKWTEQLMQRASVQQAVSSDYAELLIEFIKHRDGYLGRDLQDHAVEFQSEMIE